MGVSRNFERCGGHSHDYVSRQALRWVKRHRGVEAGAADLLCGLRLPCLTLHQLRQPFLERGGHERATIAFQHELPHVQHVNCDELHVGGVVALQLWLPFGDLLPWPKADVGARCRRDDLYAGHPNDKRDVLRETTSRVLHGVTRP